MSSTTLPVCPKTGSTSPASQSIFAYTLLREIGNAPARTRSPVAVRTFPMRSTMVSYVVSGVPRQFAVM